MKTFIFVIISLLISANPVNPNEEDTTFYPTISGPQSVDYGFFETWEGENPDMSECGSCQWRWDISKNSSFTNPGTDTWIGADGPDSDNLMSYFPIGGDIYGITSDDFYLRLVVIDGSSTYFSNTNYITVNY